MALYFIKDTTLKGIADAIRTKTGDSASIPVADFASEIESIVVGDGSSSGGGSGEGDTIIGYDVITKSGMFETGSGATSATITHNCGGEPDIVIVYLRRNDLTICGDYTTFVYSTSKINVGNLAITSGYAYQGESGISCSNTTFNVSDLAGNSRYGWYAMKLVDKEISGSVSSGDHTVTFMSEDGSTVLCRKSVMNGDSCGDPITLGLIEKPAKESTAELTYSFAGWSTTPGGGIDPDALTNITSDKTVYASFVGVVRMYTIKYYDGDSLIHSETLPYGSTPSYTPEKSGYFFSNWTPYITTVTGDAEYTAVWELAPKFSTATWEQISKASTDGNASKFFKIGDSKTITLTGGQSVTLNIIGINHDDLSDGTGKAGITLKFSTFYNIWPFACGFNNTQKTYNGTTSYTAGGWATSYAREMYDTDMYNLLPDDLKAVIKSVKKLSDDGYGGNGELIETNDKLWIPSAEELGLTVASSRCLPGQGTAYAGYSSNYSRAIYLNSSSAITYSRSCDISTNNKLISMQSNGALETSVASSVNGSTSTYHQICFCV